MYTRLRRLATRLFTERHVAIGSRRRVRNITLSRTAQIGALVLVIAGGAALARLAGNSIAAGRLVADKEAAVLQAEMSNDDLRRMVIQMQQRLAAATEEIEATRERLAAETAAGAAQRAETQSRLRGADDQLAAKAGEAARLARTLELARAERAGLERRMRELESLAQLAASQSAQDKAGLETVERKLQQIGEERDKILAERERILAERDHLLGRLAVLQQPAPLEKQRQEKIALQEKPKAETTKPETAKPAVGALDYLADETRHGWSEFVGLLASVGLDADRLAQRLGAAPPGQGGPFIAPFRLKPAAGAPEQTADLQKLLKVLPLAAPLSQYQLESRFGMRADPFNHHQSLHTGLDLSAPFRSPVYNTAPGTVIFAGPKGDFGKVVEVDHGGGIVTLYAHLHRILVAKGQRLNSRVELGQLGSTGRSSGPHVHYEVQVDGVPQDPEKFLQAGKSIIQAAGN